MPKRRRRKSGIPPFRSNTVIHDIADARQPLFAVSFVNTINEFTQDIPTKNLIDLIRQGAFDALDTSIPWAELQEQLIEGNVSQELIRALTESADAVSTQTARAVRRATGVEPVLTFDSQSAEVRRFINEQIGELVTSVTKNSRASIKRAILEARAQQTSMNEVAKRIKEAIGLRPDQERSLDKMSARWKEQGLSAKRRRELRLEARTVKLAQRADMIARTEIMTATNGGHQVGWQQAASKGYFNPDKASVVWVVINDGPRLCPTCNSMEGIPRPFKGKWIVRMLDHQARPTGVVKSVKIPNKTHPNCRCTMTLQIDEAFAQGTAPQDIQRVQREIEEA